MSRPTTVVFATQKGGVGKSTCLILLASHLYFTENTSVFVIDADSPQYSVKELRNVETNRLKEDEQFGRRFIAQGKTPLYPILPSPMTNVFDRAVPNEASAFELASHEKFASEFVLIDTPGSLAVEGIVDLLVQVDKIVVPLEPEQMSLSSTSQFVLGMNALIKQNGAQTQIIGLWNKIRIQSHADIMERQNEFFRSRGVQVLENYIPESVTMKRDDTRSTVLPVNFKNLDLKEVMDELTATIKQQNHVEEK